MKRKLTIRGRAVLIVANFLLSALLFYVAVNVALWALTVPVTLGFVVMFLTFISFIYLFIASWEMVLNG